MMRLVHLAVMASVAAAALPGAAPAQRLPSGSGALVGIVRDAASGRPVARAHVCVVLPDARGTRWSRCAPVDSSAAFRVDSLPAGTLEVNVSCGTVRIFGERIASGEVRVSEGAATRRDWAVDTAVCDPRPLRSITGAFRGYYTPGFESSEFVPCMEDAWFVPSDSLRTGSLDQRRAWAILRGARFPDGFTPGDAPRDSYGNPRYYVHWRGTVTGPGSYGHMGVSIFEMRVDSVLELRAPRVDDCAPVQAARGDPRTLAPAGRAPADPASPGIPTLREKLRSRS
ncbi:carboxypeptidase-like regulatory domain-containing protein [Longimicrobium sp.]|uniref:carboxypeptidase-like regulatory domain-containing protein n=1 Tax=Longimicrobium sp. TaxID=2029185 RepID=UPI002E351208|nr:carboxypeptidase-like regulatory domain-containing protein [Longimicrobium sp.]HEX6039373.1 carboxypeptidase-like regulatory domain-containing protein [Longimicrobium sp.]